MAIQTLLAWASRKAVKNGQDTGSGPESTPTRVERVTATWPNPAPRPEIRADDETAIALVGVPSTGKDGHPCLDSSIGTVPLDPEQAIVAGTLVTRGAWASAEDISEAHVGKIPGMLDAGMLYAFNHTDDGFYRELIPHSLVEQFEFKSVPDTVFDMVKIRVPRGSGVEDFPGVVLPVLAAVDGARSAGEVVDEAIATYLRDLGITAEELPANERADLEELRRYARLSLILAAQSGLVMLDLPA